MSIADAKKLIRNSINVLRKTKNNALVVVTKELEGTMKKRIFDRGRSVGGGKIGSYSTKPMYVSKEGAKKQYGSQINLGGLTPQGKPDEKGKFRTGVRSYNIETRRAGRSKSYFKNGKKRNSRYFAGGYREFRKAVGRQNKYVDLNLTGTLEKSITTGKRGNRVVLGFIRDRELLLAERHEKKYRKSIFSPSRTEEKVTRTNFLKEIVLNLDKAVR